MIVLSRQSACVVYVVDYEYNVFKIYETDNRITIQGDPENKCIKVTSSFGIVVHGFIIGYYID